MDKTELVRLIRDSAAVLKPLLGKLHSIPNGEEPRCAFVNPDPYALGWWLGLQEMATMLEYQECEVSDKQLHHVKAMLGIYGGNGNLGDLQFNTEGYETESNIVNEGLRLRIEYLRHFFGEGPRPYVP